MKPDQRGESNQRGAGRVGAGGTALVAGFSGLADGGKWRDFISGASPGAFWRERKLQSMPPSAVTMMMTMTIMMRSPPGSYCGGGGVGFMGCPLGVCGGF